MNNKLWFRILILASLSGTVAISGCKVSKNAKNRESADQPPLLNYTDGLASEGKESDIPEWMPTKHTYKPSKTRYHDLLHTELRVRFDWAKQYMYGQAILELKPYFFATDSLVLDAKGFDLNRVAIVEPGGSYRDLTYTYDKQKLNIKLGRNYTRDERYKLFIDYVSKPNEIEVKKGSEEDAITDRKGLYFINPDGKDPNKPRQIWTQGETEYSSCWFPTIDANNERCTQDLYITVEDQYKTLSNGLLYSSVKNSDGTRTDNWKMDQPHAPYLFMMAVGDFAVIKDQWRNMEVSYYVEPEYAKHAKMVFGNTPEMIDFFSKYFGVDYPWKKYSQVVVRDFVSGAMENTTATVHMEELQHDHRDHLDETNEDYISHELTHQWFGDYVTCESWANLTLNEGFASYGEYLWREHKYGRKDADYHLTQDQIMYLTESASRRDPLIRYHYDDPQDMFDRHSYQKGALVLHHLRKTLGEDAFKAGLQLYLRTHAYSPVEVDELRMAFEDVTGQDLKWFFDQWYLDRGHAELEISYDYSNISQVINVSVKQTQDTRYQPTFRIPTKIQIDYEGGTSFYPVVLSTKDTIFRIPSANAPLNIVFDSEMSIVSRQTETKPLDYWIHQARKGSNFRQQQIAFAYLDEAVNEPRVQSLLKEMLNDEFWALRETAVSYLSVSEQAFEAEALNKIKDVAVKDPKATVRASAVDYLTKTDRTELYPQIEEVLEQTVKDSSYAVLSLSLTAYYQINPKKALEHAKANQHIKNENVVATVAQILLAEKQPEARAYLRTALLKTSDQMSKLSLMRELSNFLESSPPEDGDIDLLKNLAENDNVWFVRFFAVKILSEYRANRPDVDTFIQGLKTTEKNPRLKEMYIKNF